MEIFKNQNENQDENYKDENYKDENNIDNKIISNLNFNQPILNDIEYPKIMSYIPEKEKNIYTCTITDYRVQSIEKIELKLTLPEINGKGTICYQKNYIFLLLKEFQIYIKNDINDNEILICNIDNEELMMNFISDNKNEYFLKYNSGKYDNFCKLKRGLYPDDIIFQKRDIIIPIETKFLNKFNLFAKTILIFKFELNNIVNIIQYDEEFKENSLEKLIKNFNDTNLNIKLEFNNNIINTDNIKNGFFLRKKTIIGQNETNSLNSRNFENCFGLSFNVKCDKYNDNLKFIIAPQNSMKENILINEYIKKLLPDMIKITNLDLTKNDNKEKLGYNKNSIFKKLNKDNYIYHDDDNRNKCKILIENVPENYNIYYHSNILCFTRRYNKNNMINISNLFYYIKGFCYIEDDLNINFIIDEIQHDINIKIISIPVNIWNDERNTSTRDLRSIKNKNSDIYYSNPFILGMDFLSKDKGYKNLSIKAGKDILENYYIENKTLDKQNNIFKIKEFDKYVYPHIALINTYSNITHKYISSNKNINFNSFLFNINWVDYPDYNPLSFYKKYPSISLYELVLIIYDIKNNNINIEIKK